MRHQTITSQRTRIRGAIAKLRPGAQRRYPETLQEDIASFARARLETGGTRCGVCEELGIGGPTLARFLSEHGTVSRLSPAPIRSVVITEDQAEQDPGGGIVVRAPGGIVVEGLDVAGVVEMMRGLACSA